MAVVLPQGVQHFDTPTGAPGVGYRLYTYVPGTSTPKATYTTSAGNVPNTNPVVADALGNMVVYWSGDYDVVLRDASDNIVWGPERLTDLAGALADTTTAANNSYLVGHGDSLSYTPGPRVANYIRNYTTPLAYTGCPTDGTSDASSYVAAAFASGKKEIIIPDGFVFSVDGNLAVPTGARIRGGGTLKKRAGTVRPILLLADSAEDILIEGVHFDGTRASFSIGNAVPAILGHLCEGVRIHYAVFENVIDSGVKLRNCAYLEVIGGRFHNIGEHGVEIKNYDVDVRTGLAYVASLPPLQGGHKITKAVFTKIDNGSGDGSGDGCGISFATVITAAGTAYPIKGSGVFDNDFLNVKRGVWVENNDAGCETEDLQVIGNRFRGDIASYGGDVYQAIGLIGVKRAQASYNSILNVGNMNVTLPSDSCNGIVVSQGSNTTDEVELSHNTIIDNTGNAVRMDYAVRLTAGTNLRVFDNRVSGASESPINVESAAVSDLICYGNTGAQDSYSWGNTFSVTFKLSNIPGTATTALTPEGHADDTEMIFPFPVRLVATAVKQTNNVASGTIEYRFYTNGVLRSNLSITQADISSAQATKTIGVTSGVTVAAGSRIRVDVVTSGFTPTTCDVIATLTFDTSFKE